MICLPASAVIHMPAFTSSRNSASVNSWKNGSFLTLAYRSSTSICLAACISSRSKALLRSVARSSAEA